MNPQKYKEGIRLIMLTLRGKDGGKRTKGDRVAKKKLSSSQEEFNAIVEKFKEEVDASELPLRIYSSVNPRDIEKGIMEFKRIQLEHDYAAHVFATGKNYRHEFYLDIYNRWISSIMQPACRASTEFLIDCDTPEQEREAREALETLKIPINYGYATKNGYHIITNPFNPTKFPLPVSKDGLLLVYYKGCKISL